jgi:hypothetical protein
MEQLNKEIEQLKIKYEKLIKLQNMHGNYHKCAEYSFRIAELIRVQLLIANLII